MDVFLWVQNVVDDSRVVNNGVIHVAICTLVHLLVATKHRVEGMGQGDLLTAVKEVEYVVLALDLVSSVQRHHDQRDVAFES